MSKIEFIDGTIPSPLAVLESAKESIDDNTETLIVIWLDEEETVRWRISSTMSNTLWMLEKAKYELLGR
jgi:hypothetical protein